MKSIKVEDLSFFKDTDTGRIGISIPGADRIGCIVLKWCPDEWIKGNGFMRGGSLLKHKLNTGITQLYEIESIDPGGTGEIGLVKLNVISGKNSKKEQIAVPANMISAMIRSGILTVYNSQD